MHVCIYTYRHTHTHINICMYVFVCAYVVYVCTYIYTYTYHGLGHSFAYMFLDTKPGTPHKWFIFGIIILEINFMVIYLNIFVVYESFICLSSKHNYPINICIDPKKTWILQNT